MDIDTELSAKLSETANISNQRDRIQVYLSTLESLISARPLSTDALIAFGRHFTTSTSMAMVVGRRVLGDYVQALASGAPNYVPSESVAGGTTDASFQSGKDNTEPAAARDNRLRWVTLGRAAFSGSQEAEEARKVIVQGVLEPELAGWCEEQTTILRHVLCGILQEEEDWVGAARALMTIPLDGSSRVVPDEEKLNVYIKIVRLLLEGGESGRAQDYFSRASLLIHVTTDKETILAYRLSHARILDYTARFVQAAQIYHEVSLNSAIVEDDRLKMLSFAVTTSILAPAGPQRSRILASLNRDDRVHTSLPPHLSTMLRKMLLDYIVRPEEMQEFERGLEDHQRAFVAGGGTVLERAVREHNVGACGKVYDNISFDALGELLGLNSRDAEAMARRMIEQARLRAWIDQPLGLLYFESRALHDTDADAQGTAGGLGIEKVEKEIEPVSWTERWDDWIRETSLKVESITELIQKRGLLDARV